MAVATAVLAGDPGRIQGLGGSPQKRSRFRVPYRGLKASLRPQTLNGFLEGFL